MLSSYGDTFKWFYGIVEDRNDPLKLGRVRVRVWGHHTGDISKIKTNDLPWAAVGLSANNALLNGIGESPTGLVEGSMVWGFWRDGDSMQEPVVISVFGGIPTRPTQETRSTNSTSSNERKAVFNKGVDPDTGDLVEPLKNIERNPNLDINLLVIHCTATKPTQDIGAKEVRRWHINRGWSDIGYHFIIRRNGVVESGRDVNKQGAHALGFNKKSIGISLVGGVDENGNPQNNYTTAQWESLKNIIEKYNTDYEGIKIIGHNEVSSKACPSFDVQKWLQQTFPDNQIASEDLDSLNDDNVEDQQGFKQLESVDDGKSDLGETEGFADDVSDGNAFLNELYPENNFGFLDPNGVYPKEDFLNEPDVNRLARGESLADTIVSKKNESRDNGVNIALGGTWDEPESPYNALYPYNHVTESESGHVIEVDDTRGHERIHIYHRTGTFEELHPNGDRVQKIIGKNYEIIASDNNVFIKGNCNITVDNNVNLLVNGNVNAEVNGDIKSVVTGKVDFDVEGEIIFNSQTSIFLGAPRIDIDFPLDK